MGTPGPAPEITPDDALGVFTELERPSTPLTATDVAEELGCTRRTAHRKLDELDERDDLETKKPGAHSRVWWRPVAEQEADDGTRSVPREEFADFVRSVEDYAIFRLEPDGTVATWNQGAHRIKGYEEAVIVGEHFSTFYTDDAIEAGVPDRNLETAAEEGRIEDEGWRVRADGSRFWANVTITAIRDDDGDLRGFTKVTRDMTERREHERELERERNRTEELVRNAPIPIAVQDENGETVMANERAQDALGLSEEDIREGIEDEDEWAVYDGDGRPLSPAEFAPVRAHASGEPVYDEEVAIERPDGERTWFSVNAVPFSGPDGEESGVVIAGEDITNLKVRQQELETELQEILGRVSDAFYALDDEFRFTHVNDHAVEILQHSRDELLGHRIWDVFPGQRDGVYGQHLEEAMETQETVSFEVHEPGIDSWLEFSVYPSASGLSVYFQDVTERKERERELEKYETIIETMNDGIYVKDEEGYFAMVNEAYAEMTGYAPEDLVGEHASLVVDEDTMAESKAALSDAGAKPTVEAALRTADGDAVPAEGTFAVLPTGEEVGVVRDVSRRKERERELERYGTIVETVEDGIYTVDDERHFSMVNEAYSEMVGYDREELLGEPVTMVVDEETAERAQKREDRLRTGEDASPIEAELVTAAGDHFPAEATFGLLPGGDPDYQRVGVVRDVTERVEREQTLAERERQLSTLMDNVPGMVYRCRNERGWPMQFVSEGSFELTGYDPETVESGEVSYGGEVVHEDDREDLWEDVQQGLAEDGSFNVTYRLRTADGDVRWVRERGRGIYEDGDLVTLEGVIIDVTERKRAQERLAEERDMFAQGPAVVFQWEPDPDAGWPVEYVSENVEEVFGYPPEQLESGEIPYVDLLLDEELERIAREVEDAVAGGADRLTHDPYRVRTTDGGTKWVKDSTKIIRDDDGDVERLLGYLVDVTERKQRERELEDTKSRLEAAIDAGAVGTWEWDIQEDSMVANPSFAKTYGLDPDAVSDGVPLERFTSAIHEEDRQRVQEQIDSAVETCGEYEAEFRVWTADDELRWVVARGHVECDEDGNAATLPGALTDITERKAYQRRIEESERRYRALIENFPDGAVGLFDEDLRYTAVGGQFLDQVTVSKEERIGERVTDIYPDDIVEEAEPHFEAALAGEHTSFHVRFHGRDLDAATLPVTDADGDIIAGMLVVQDVTERREAQRELRESEAKFRMLAENLEEIVWMASPDADEFRYVNPAYEDVWGRDREELYEEPLTFLDGIHPEDRERLAEKFEALPEEDLDDEFRVVSPDGEIRWVHSRGAQVYDEDEDMTRVVGIGEDVTERVERERELERALDLLERTERIADVGGWVVDPDTQGVFWTDHVFDILDVDADEEPPLEEALDMYHEDDRPEVEAAVEEALASGEDFDVEVRLETGRGDQRWVRLQGAPETTGGEVRSLRGAAQDVTERIERERHLETLVEQLEESNERLERFAYVASHDLQEPLRMISNYLQLLDRRYRDELDEDAEEFIDFAVDGAERMREMISDLLAYSRLDSEAEPLEPTDAEEVVDDVLEDLHLRIEETNADVSVGELPTVQADPQQLEMVFQNLLSNALKYSGEEPPDVDVDATRRNGEWVFGVADDGIGIDPDHTEDIFEVFNRLHTHEEYPGTGIGLAMCKKIVRRHGGDIWVDSEPGEGSTVSFSIPVDAAGREILTGPASLEDVGEGRS